MNLQLPKLIQKCRNADIWPRLRIEVVGIIEDFWKAPTFSKTVPVKPVEPVVRPALKTESKKEPSAAIKKPNQPPQTWHADHFQVMEKIWGEGHIRPSSEELLKKLVAPIGSKKNINVLDLSAGLGGLARKLASELKANVTGLETDATMALRGKSLTLEAGLDKQVSLEAYDPATFTAGQLFDAVVACELFYRVIGKDKLFKTIVSSLKPRGVVTFTDYILETSARNSQGITAWLSYEKNATPLSLDDMTQGWSKLGLDVRKSEDLTSAYLREIVLGLKDFAIFMAQNPPDETTRSFVLREIDKWARRAAAMKQGLKIYRFEALKV